jgi:hypothetical protein
MFEYRFGFDFAKLEFNRGKKYKLFENTYPFRFWCGKL